MKIKLILSGLTALRLLFPAAAGPEYKTPENSKLFRKVTNADGIVSYLLEKRIADNQQSFYFTQKSMSEDGRFLLFYVSPSRGTRRQVAMIDFKDESMKILGIEHGQCDLPFFDSETGKLYYVNRSGIFLRDLNGDPMREIKICPIPEDLKAMGEKIHHFCTHVTLSKDRSKLFLDPRIDDKFVQGTVDLKTGKFQTWGVADFFINHSQINPEDDGIALAAWETRWRDSKGEMHRIHKINGIYPRLWLLWPDGTRKMIPSMTNYATHEHWTEDGKGFYFCAGKGVVLHDLKTGKQKLAVRHKAAHATINAVLTGAVFDFPVGTWFRGCSWGVVFANLKTGKMVPLYRQCPAYNTRKDQSKLHPDPHPQFVCGDKYVICTVNGGRQRMELSVTPVQQLLDKTK